MSTTPSKETSDPRLDELRTLVAPSVMEMLLKQRGAASTLLRRLPQKLSDPGQRAWQLTGLHLVAERRFYDAIVVFEGWYQLLLRHQAQRGAWLHKGAPLVWMRDCYVNLGHPALAKRFMMLTLIEDAVRGGGTIDTEKTGSYFRAVWYHGMADGLLRRYTKEISAFAGRYERAAWYPERVLQNLDRLWMTEIPQASEMSLYPANRRYIRELLAETGGDTSGRALEILAEYLLSVMPGCRTHRRKRSFSTDYDIVCSLDGFDLDFRSELGRYFVCECKDWKEPVNFGAFAKFARVLDSTKSRFGVLFSRSGITGTKLSRDAAREQVKLFQDRGIIVVVVRRADIEAVVRGVNFIALLKEKYEAVRLDLMPQRGDLE